MRFLRTVVLLLVTVLTLTACEFSVYNMPLPGGVDTGEDPLRVQVRFDDVLDLVPQSQVKVNDVTVGTVAEVELDGYTAVVTVELKRGVDLPADAVATIGQTSLLGEKYVALEAPKNPSDEPLQSGDVIPLERTGANPEVEQVLGALSLILNGGGIAQLKTIATEINKALEGREGAARSVLHQIEDLVGTLDRNKDDIVRAIEALNRLSISANNQIETIDAALEELPSALRSIDRQRDDLVKMLRALNRLGKVGTEVIRASKQGTIKSLERLVPVLNQLGKAGDDLVNAFSVALTYPFVDEAVGRDPQVARNLHMGDYVNLSIQLDLDLTQGLPQAPVLDEVDECLASGNLTGPDCTNLPADALEDVCELLPGNPLCPQLLDLLDGGGQGGSTPGGTIGDLLGQLGLSGSRGGSGGGAGGGGSGGGSGGGGTDGGLLGGLDDLLGNVDGLLGANRAAPGGTSGVPERARIGVPGRVPTGDYDPALVQLLAPGVTGR